MALQWQLVGSNYSHTSIFSPITRRLTAHPIPSPLRNYATLITSSINYPNCLRLRNWFSPVDGFNSWRRKLNFVCLSVNKLIEVNREALDYSPRQTVNWFICWIKAFGSNYFGVTTLTPELSSTLDKVVASQKVLLFMKGTKEFPQCGFSNTVVQILTSLNVPFETINILENDMLRQALKEYSSWPTFPQLYINGEFFGGCDITVEAYKAGQLQEVLEKAMCS